MKFTYEELVKLGFKRIDSEDTVWEKRHGFPYFILSIGNDHYSLEWDIFTQELEFQKLGKNCTITSREKVASNYHLDTCLRIIKGTTPLSESNENILADFKKVYEAIDRPLNDEQNSIMRSGCRMLYEVTRMKDDIYTTEQDMLPLIIFIKSITDRLIEIEDCLVSESLSKVNM